MGCGTRLLGRGGCSSTGARLDRSVGESERARETGLGSTGGKLESTARTASRADESRRAEEMGGGIEVVCSSASGASDTASRSSIESIGNGDELSSSVRIEGGRLLSGGSGVASPNAAKGINEGGLVKGGRSLTAPRDDTGGADRGGTDSGRLDSMPSGLETGREKVCAPGMVDEIGDFDEAGLGTELRNEICGSGLLLKLACVGGGCDGGPAGTESSSGKDGSPSWSLSESGAVESDA